MGKFTASSATEHKTRLRDYFDGVGFERWSAIYGQGELSGVRRSVREGHNIVLDYVQQWIEELHLPAGAHILDAGCGTGLLSVALAQRGYRITAVDIAPQMVQATSERASVAGVAASIETLTGDLEGVGGSYDVVVCLDVLIHYPRSPFEALATHLASLSRGGLLLTYAPYNMGLAMLHHIGGVFPKGQRRTEIQMIPEHIVHKTLAQAGMQTRRSVRVSKGFYHVALLEAGR